MREYQVRICERLGVKFPGPTRQKAKYSLRAYVFRFAPESELKSDSAPCRFRATIRRRRTASWSQPGGGSFADWIRRLGTVVTRVRPQVGSLPPASQNPHLDAAEILPGHWKYALLDLLDVELSMRPSHHLFAQTTRKTQ